MADKRALKILNDTYWSSKGWKCASHPAWVPTTPPADLAHAMSQGVMFPPLKVTHEETIASIIELRERVIPAEVGAAFVSSLERGSLALRSALGTRAVAMHMPDHPFTSTRHPWQCDVSGFQYSQQPQDFNVLNFERYKWGGVRHTDPVYIAFDLERFQAERGEHPEPPQLVTLTALLKSLHELPPGAKRKDLVDVLKELVPGGAQVRETVLFILGYAGILRVAGRSGFFRAFTPLTQREETPSERDFWPYPTNWYRPGDGIDSAASAYWFGISPVSYGATPRKA